MTVQVLNDLAFLEGSWVCDVWGGTFEETWTSPAGGTMSMCGRHIKAGKTRFMEFGSIEVDLEGISLYMVLGLPSRGEQQTTRFALKHNAGAAFVFETLKNDYPQRIIYKPVSKDEMHCRIESSRSDPSRFDLFNFRRV